MNRRLAKTLTHLYPASWQRRYAEEFSLFLEESDGGIFSVANVISSAIREHIHLQEEQIMNRSQDASGLVVLSFVAAIAGGVNLIMTVDDSALIGAMGLHRSQDVMWDLMAVAAILAGGAALSIAVPLYRSMLLYAHRTHRRCACAPPCSVYWERHSSALGTCRFVGHSRKMDRDSMGHSEQWRRSSVLAFG